jgi:hypothetical protein
MAITRKEEVPLNQYVAAMCETWREDLLMAINAQEEVKRRRANACFT